jgi:hypothetical protein
MANWTHYPKESVRDKVATGAVYEPGTYDPGTYEDGWVGGWTHAALAGARDGAGSFTHGTLSSSRDSGSGWVHDTLEGLRDA